ncbi:MAG: hypothetical protein JST51_17700 [Armatimonadetes bacterium]|nr:hypothetical protein [Armatimonadota bacterium]
MTLDPVAVRLAQAWGFEPTEELPGGHCSHVYATSDKVLKVPYQGEEMTSGYWAMVGLDGEFAPRIFESDPATGSMLMERAIPGTKLHESGVDPAEQTEIWRHVALSFRSLMSEKLMTMAEYTGAKDPLVVHLLETTEREVPLHGDLHHENILRHGDGWMVIDAKGLVGDPAIEAAAFVCNPIADLAERTANQFLERVYETANALDVDPFRVWGWSLARMREDTPERGEPWWFALQGLNQCASAFDAERWVRPLA